MRTDRVVMGLLAILAGVATADTAGAADAYNGGQIARRWCEPCHVVAGDQQGTTGEAPPFASIVSARPASEDAEHVAHPHRGRRPRGVYREPREIGLSIRPVAR
jgi:hypothetical protein